MIEKIWKKIFNLEVISYIIFGVLTTAVDWIVYSVMRFHLFDYRWATVGSWCAAVLFAFITNKLFVFRSLNLNAKKVIGELIPFVGCRGLTGLFQLVGMMVLVDFVGVDDFISKLVISVIVLLLNYIFSKIFIFKKADKGRYQNEP